MAKYSYLVCTGDCVEQAQRAFAKASQTALSEPHEMADLQKRFALLREVDGTDQHKNAEITLEHALALYEAAFGQEHPSVAELMLALAELYSAHDKQEYADYMRAWAKDIMNRPKEEPTHEFFHLVGMDASEAEMGS